MIPQRPPSNPNTRNNSRKNSFSASASLQPKNPNTSSSSSSSSSSNSIVPEAAKKAAADYLSFLKHEQEQKALEKEHITFLHNVLRKALDLCHLGKFEVAVDEVLSATTFVPSQKNIKNHSLPLVSAQYAIALSLPMMLCGCFPPRFEEAKLKIVEGYTLASNETEIEQVEYNLKVVEALEDRFISNQNNNKHDRKMEKASWFCGGDQEEDMALNGPESLIDLFYIVAPAASTEEKQQEEEPKPAKLEKEEKKNDQDQTSNHQLSTSPPASRVRTDQHKNPPKSNDDVENTTNTNNISMPPFVNILPASTTSTFPNLLKKNLVPLLVSSAASTSTFPCCHLCLLRSLTFAALSLHKTTKSSSSIWSVSWSEIFVVKESPISEALRKVEKDLSMNNTTSNSCCAIPFHNVLWFKKQLPEEDESNNDQNFISTMKAIAEKLPPNNREREKIIDYLDGTPKEKFDLYHFLTLLKSSPAQQATTKSSSSTSTKKSKKNKTDSPFTLSFLDSFNLFIQPATQLALKEKGTLHLRLNREFLFSGVAHFFSSLQLQIDDHHKNDNNDRILIDDDNDNETNQDPLLLLRPLAVTFQGESGIDACLGGLTNDMLQRFCEQFEQSLIFQFVEGKNEEAENEYGDAVLRALSFGRVFAKCFLEKRKVALRNWRFFCHAVVCGSNEVGWIQDDSEDDARSRNLEAIQHHAMRILEPNKKTKNDDHHQHKTESSSSSSSKPTTRRSVSLQMPDQQDDAGFIVTLTMENDDDEDNDDDIDHNRSTREPTSKMTMMMKSDDLKDIELFSTLSKPTSAARSCRVHQQEKLKQLLQQHSEVLDAMRTGFGEFICGSLPHSLSKFLVFPALQQRKNTNNKSREDENEKDTLELANAAAFSTNHQSHNNNDDSDEDTDDHHLLPLQPSLENLLRSSRLVSSVCCCCGGGGNDQKSIQHDNNDDEEITGKQVVQNLEFRGWGARSSMNNNEQEETEKGSRPPPSLEDSTPYYLCCWLHYQATPEMRRKFLRFTTCVPHISSSTSAQQEGEDLESGNHNNNNRIIVRRDPDRLFARTCLRTLHLPSYSTLQDLQESLEMAIFVAENIDQEMHE